MSIELRTHTGLWNVEKKLYSFYDVQLPFPVSLRQLAVVVGFGVPWMWLVGLLNVPFEPPFGYLVYLAPPGFLAWASSKPLLEGKSIWGLVGSQVKYLGEPRKFSRLRPHSAPEMIVVRCELWHPGRVQDRTRVAEPQSLFLIDNAEKDDKPTRPQRRPGQNRSGQNGRRTPSPTGHNPKNAGRTVQRSPRTQQRPATTRTRPDATRTSLRPAPAP